MKGAVHMYQLPSQLSGMAGVLARTNGRKEDWIEEGEEDGPLLEEEPEPTVRVKRKPANIRRTFSRGAVIKLRLENFL